MPIDAIRKLTLWQIEHVYYHPRDKNGELIDLNMVRPQSPQEIFFSVWRRRGLPEWRIRRKWTERQNASES